MATDKVYVLMLNWGNETLIEKVCADKNKHLTIKYTSDHNKAQRFTHAEAQQVLSNHNLAKDYIAIPCKL
jgi:hypothetical protein